MIDKVVLNKTKKKSIVFIHGFYATSGFWLPYISNFKDFKIILLNINYIEILNKSNPFSEIRSIISDCFNLNDNLIAIISHSLGTVLSGFIDLQNCPNRYEICPVCFGERLEDLEFVNELALRTKVNQEEIQNNLLKVDLFINQSKNKVFDYGLKLIPAQDNFFSYNYPKKNQYIFKGDHFDIHHAIDLIQNRILNNC